MPGNIKFLNLEGTRIVELPPSVCELKLTSGTFSLKGCRSLGIILNFPRDIRVLNLDETSIKELPRSIGNLIELQTLSLRGCKELEVVPDINYNLTNLKTLNFGGCLKLEKLPSVSVGLRSLEVLIVWRTGILKIPDDLVGLTTLRDLDLRATKIESIPASVKQASQLSRLRVSNCKSLVSLPELPLMMSNIEANDCTSLKTVSSSRTLLTQVWEEYKCFPVLPEKIEFYNCPKLDDNARSNIMDDAQLRIMLVATLPLCYLKQHQQQQPQVFYDGLHLVKIVCPGNEIPSWFRYQNNEGSSINIKLPEDWFREGFLGFALSIVPSKCLEDPFYEIRCEYSFKTNNDESHEIDYNERPALGRTLECHQVFVWYNAAFELVERANSESFLDFKRVTEASVDFFYVHGRWGQWSKVEKCGISRLYAQDAEIIKTGKLKVEEEKTKKRKRK